MGIVCLGEISRCLVGWCSDCYRIVDRIQGMCYLLRAIDRLCVYANITHLFCIRVSGRYYSPMKCLFGQAVLHEFCELISFLYVFDRFLALQLVLSFYFFCLCFVYLFIRMMRGDNRNFFESVSSRPEVLVGLRWILIMDLHYN